MENESKTTDPAAAEKTLAARRDDYTRLVRHVVEKTEELVQGYRAVESGAAEISQKHGVQVAKMDFTRHQEFGIGLAKLASCPEATAKFRQAQQQKFPTL